MYIDSVYFYENEIFGNQLISLSSGSMPWNIGNKDVTLLKSDNVSNLYTFIIGDNGVGKTNLLNFISNIYHNSKKKMSYQKDIDASRRNFAITDNTNKAKPYIKYIGSGLYSADSELDGLDIKMVNPNRMSVQRQIISLFCHYSKKMYLLEDRLKKRIVPIAHLGVTYRTTAKDQNMFINLGINNDLVTKQMLLVIASPKYVANRNVDVLKDKIMKLDCYRYLEEHFKDFNSLLKSLYDSDLCKEYRSFLKGMSYDYKENKIEVMLKRFKQSASKSFLNLRLYETKEIDMLFVMMLEELGIIRITINCEFLKGCCNVNALSTGEKIIIKMFSFFAEITEKRRKNIIFLYDEPENSLHPQWQKEFPEMFRTIAEDVYDIKNSHFIFTTHSPHVIMRSTELEHSNVLRMQRDEDRNVYVEKIDDVPRFSFEKILLDVFGCSYYTEREIESNKSLINEKINTNRLNVVNFSFDINEAIDDLYNKLFDD